MWNASAALVAVYSAITVGAYATGYALHLGASDTLIGFLAAAPAWMQVLQMVSPVLIERRQRRKPFCLAAYAVGYSMWLPIALIPLMFAGAFRPWAMVLFIAVASAALALASPAATSWLTDLVPLEARGRFIARQQSLMAGVGLAASVAAGRYLDLFPTDKQQTGFLWLFIIAVAFALASVTAWGTVPEPPKRQAAPHALTTFLLLPFRHVDFRNFTILVALRTMSVMIAGPFFIVYMLKNLEIPYAQIAILSAMMTLAYMAANSLWAYLAGKFGYRPVLTISHFGLSVLPVVWFFATKSNYWLVISAIQVWAGVMNSGLMLSQFNLMLKIAPEESRSMYIGSHAAVVNVAVALGAMLGGVLAQLFSRFGNPVVLGHSVSNLQWVFLVSASCRLFSLLMLSPIKEERAVATHVVIQRVGRGRPFATFWNLLRMARSPDPQTKAQAARALGNTRSALAVDELIALLEDSDGPVRREAAWALGEIGDQRGVEPLIQKVRDPWADMVEEVVASLGRIPTPQSLAALLALLDDARPSVRTNAARALGEMANVRAQGPLEQLLEREHDPGTFVATLEALSKLGSKPALHHLRRLLRSSHPGLVRMRLANAMGNLLGPPGAFYPLLQAEPMRQEEMVAHLSASCRRRLRRRVARSGRARDYVALQLDTGLQHFAMGRYAHAVGCLRGVAWRAMRSFAASEPGAILVAAQRRRRHRGPGIHRRVPLLLEANEHLRRNFGFLSGLHSEGRRRQLHREEALLGVFAFQQLVDELALLAGTHAEPTGQADA